MNSCEGSHPTAFFSILLLLYLSPALSATPPHYLKCLNLQNLCLVSSQIPAFLGSFQLSQELAPTVQAVLMAPIQDVACERCFGSYLSGAGNAESQGLLS